MIRAIFLSFFFFSFYEIKAEISRNSGIDSLDKCAGNNTKFIECKNSLKEILKSSGLNLTGHLNLKYQAGSLVTWSPLNRSEFEAYCTFAPKTDECLNVPGVREACPDEMLIKLSDMFYYFCKPERKSEFLNSLECVWRIDTWYEVDRCVRAEMEISSIKSGQKSESALLCRILAAALDCSKENLVNDCGQKTFDFMHKAAATILEAIDPKCDIDAEIQKRKK